MRKSVPVLARVVNHALNHIAPRFSWVARDDAKMAAFEPGDIIFRTTLSRGVRSVENDRPARALLFAFVLTSGLLFGGCGNPASPTATQSESTNSASRVTLVERTNPVLP